MGEILHCIQDDKVIMTLGHYAMENNVMMALGHCIRGRQFHHALNFSSSGTQMKRLILLLFLVDFFPIMLWAQNNPFPSDNNGGVSFRESVSSELSRDALFDRVMA